MYKITCLGFFCESCSKLGNISVAVCRNPGTPLAKEIVPVLTADHYKVTSERNL